MKTPKIFRFKIETSLLAYCDEDLLYQFVEDLRNNSDSLTVTIPLVCRDVVDVTEDVKIKAIYSGDVVLDNQEFQNGTICKLESGEVSGFRGDYSFRFIGEDEAIADGEEFEFGESFFEEDLFLVNDSMHWSYEVKSIRLSLRRFGKILKAPSSFPMISEYESDNLRKKCAVVDSIYRSWIMNGDDLDEETKNRMNYYFLRYPNIEKVFAEMKESRVD